MPALVNTITTKHGMTNLVKEEILTPYNNHRNSFDYEDKLK
jgi:hypothetical protein